MALLPNFVPYTWDVTNQGERTEVNATPGQMCQYLADLNADPFSTWGSTAERQPTMVEGFWSLFQGS
jgi:hypothetical protein